MPPPLPATRLPSASRRSADGDVRGRRGRDRREPVRDHRVARGVRRRRSCPEPPCRRPSTPPVLLFVSSRIEDVDARLAVTGNDVASRRRGSADGDIHGADVDAALAVRHRRITCQVGADAVAFDDGFGRARVDLAGRGIEVGAKGEAAAGIAGDQVVADRRRRRGQIQAVAAIAARQQARAIGADVVVRHHRDQSVSTAESWDALHRARPIRIVRAREGADADGAVPEMMLRSLSSRPPMVTSADAQVDAVIAVADRRHAVRAETDVIAGDDGSFRGADDCHP